MKRETKAILVLGIVIWGAVLSHVTHSEPVVEVKESFKFVKVKDWVSKFKGKQAKYYEHLYKISN